MTDMPYKSDSVIPDLNVDHTITVHSGRNRNWLNRRKGLLAPVVYSDVDEAWRRTGL
jgi:hypothetical protein